MVLYPVACHIFLEKLLCQPGLCAAGNSLHKCHPPKAGEVYLHMVLTQVVCSYFWMM